MRITQTFLSMKPKIKNVCKGKRKAIMRMLMFLIFSLAVSQSGYSQADFTGKVVDDNGDPIAGVTVVIKGTTTGVITDLEGNYSIQAEVGDILQFSFVGFLTKEIPVTSSMTSLDVTMETDLIGLEQVVVVGYGTQRKSDLTSSVVSVSSDEFVQGQVKDVGQLLQGKVAGLSIHNPSGNPMDTVQVRLRGISSLKSGYSPLVIIDGIPGDLNMVAPQDIESVSVLKDGSAAAIYGTRGTNGVIIITTKKGSKNQPMSVEYSGYISTQTMYKKAPFYNAEDIRSLAANGVDNISDEGSDTDWLDEITHTPFSQMHSLSVLGGTERSSYMASINYNKYDGIFNKSYRETIKSRLDITHEIWKNILAVNLGAYTSRNKNPDLDINGAYRQALIHNPTEPIKNEDGTWFEIPDKFQYENPVALLEETEAETKGLQSRVYGNLILTPITDLKFNLLLSHQIYNQVWGRAESFNHISNIRDNQRARAERSAINTEENLLEFTGEYSKSFGSHRLNLVGGYSYQYYSFEEFWMMNRNFPSDVFGYDNMTLGAALTEGSAEMTSNRNMSILAGFFGRLNYSYSGKYLLSASLRYEGSSKFGENYQWGSFPAIQAGWRISQEGFMKNLDFITDIKIRAGYGETGIIPKQPYRSLTRLKYDSYVYINQEWRPTIIPDGNPNPDLRWEKKKETNIGLDYALMNGRIYGTVDYYIRKSEDLLYDYPVAMPPYLTNQIFANAASMENKGIEVLLAFIPVQSKDIQWTSSINFSSNTNKLVSLEGYGFEVEYDYIDAGYTGDPIQQQTHRTYVGEGIGNFWGYKAVDLDDRGHWLIETPEGDTVRYTAAQPEDKMALGNGIPKFYLGWNNTIKYKDFDLSIALRGAFGFQILNFQRMFYENPTITYNMLESAHDLVFDKDTLDSPQAYVSYYIEDGDYMKIDNVVLGYTFVPKNTDNLKSVRIYISMHNLYTFTKYKGIDPEVSLESWGNDIFSPGNDNRDKYPTTRTFTLGLNARF